ncbi:hypothetical protein LZ32DRAFT_604063 [Colletotrichum eremochloae]|nr:hypothetical protein LZ32DRAFT_604063 [Colletotrichum eremochloae]
MEQIETQVSDLRYLTQATIPLPSDRAVHSPHNHSHSPLSATPGDNSAQHPGPPSRDPTAAGTPGSSSVSGSKRKLEDESNAAKQQRSKRNRYISIAW